MSAKTVLWPSDLPPSNGICYGWTQPLLVVADIIPLDLGDDAKHSPDEVIAAATAHPQWVAVQSIFGAQPTIIGRCDAPTMEKGVPSLRFGDNASNYQIVEYRRHRRQSMRFYTFDFNEMDILPSQESIQDSSPGGKGGLNDDFLRGDFSRERAAGSRRGTTLDEEVLLQINYAQLLADIVDGRLDSAVSSGHAPLPEGGPVPEPLHLTASASMSKVHDILRILRDFSTTADQLDVRLEQGIYVAGEVPYVYYDKACTIASISKYIKFHNCVWLVLNDIIIGVAFGSFLCENHDVLAQMLNDFNQYYLIHRMELALLWLNNWPAGLKLNTELSQFYCQSLIGVVSAWGWFLTKAAPYFPTLIWLVGASGWCGMTMIVSLLSDALGLLTAHLYACYFISATVFRHQLSLAGSLWNLFRGKRYNVLRNRIDSWDYELDQLLLGTILFTLVAFLYPTVLTYYALFATARLAVMMLHAVFDTVTALLNHFPLFALLLRVKDPLRLPGML
ncbi:Gpi1-domain-containing protein [Trametes polyzona]|nr:Gpi1-domain-containing protein [Trametes polyzona]